MRAVLAVVALLALVALFADLSPRKMFAPVPAARMPAAASVPYAYSSPYAQPAAFSAKHRVPMFLPAGEARIATLALMPGNGEIPEVKQPKQQQPKVTIYWGKILSTALLFAAIGYVGSTYDSQSTDTSILSTVGKWLSDPPFKEVPEEHVDVLGIPMGRQTRTEVNYGSLFLLGSIVPGRIFMSKTMAKAQELFQEVFFGKKDLKSFVGWRISLEKNAGKKEPMPKQPSPEEPLEQLEGGTADDAEVGAEAIWGSVSPENRQERHFD
jgi:hypothetical protein